MPFFTFNQNNSGGRFIVDEKRGIGTGVIIEADDYEEANERAELIGLYFDDDYYTDCRCCGTRWSRMYEFDRGYAVPSVYGEPLDDLEEDIGVYRKKSTTFVHYKKLKELS